MQKLFNLSNMDVSELEFINSYIENMISKSLAEKDFSKAIPVEKLQLDSDDLPFIFGDEGPFREVTYILPEDQILMGSELQYNDFFEYRIEFELKDNLLNIHCFWMTSISNSLSNVPVNFTLCHRKSHRTKLLKSCLESLFQE